MPSKRCSCGYETADRGNFCKHQKRCSHHAFSTQLHELRQENMALKAQITGMGTSAEDRLQSAIDELRLECRASIASLQRQLDKRPPTTSDTSAEGLHPYKGEPAEDRPSTAEMKTLLTKPQDSIAGLVRWKLARFANVRINNVRSKYLQVVESAATGEQQWVHRDRKATVCELVEDALDELVDEYGAEKSSMWRQWYASSGLTKEGYDKTDAYKTLLAKVEQVLLDMR